MTKKSTKTTKTTKTTKKQATQTETQTKSKRGWKMEFIKSEFSKLAKRPKKKIQRQFLAQMIGSDERNTHIMISKIKESGEFLNVEYDRKTRTYSLAQA